MEVVLSLLNRLLGSFREAEKRDRMFISQLDLRTLDNILWPLYIAFICLNFLDVYSTLLAIGTNGAFRELNPIAAVLFDLHFRGFLLAMLFKYLPAIPLFYAVFVRESSATHQFEIRLVKFAALVTLVASDLLLVYVVGLNNIPELAKAAFS